MKITVELEVGKVDGTKNESRDDVVAVLIDELESLTFDVEDTVYGVANAVER